MPALIVELLQEALKRFQHVAEGSAEGLSTLQWTEQLGPALAEPVADELKPQLQGLVLQLADALCDLTPAATAVLDRLRGAADLDARLGATYQVAAAGSVLYCCSELAKQLDLADRDAFRLAAASQLVLAAGPLTLRQLKSVAEMQQVQAGGQLSGVSAVLLQQAAQAAMEDMTRVLLQQLCAVAATIGSLLSADRRPQAAAAFASSTARPAVLIPWLRDVTECLRFVRQLDGAEQVVTLHLALFRHTRCISWIADSPCWSKHNEALAADPALQAALAEVLLTQTLPAVAQPGCPNSQRAHLIGQVLYVLVASSMQQAVQQVLRQPGGSERVAAAVRCLLGMLPAEPPADAAINDVRLYSCAAQLATMLVSTACKLAPASGSTAEASRSASSSGSSSGGSSSSSMLSPAAWQLLALPALPKLLRLLQGYAGAPNLRVGQPGSNAEVDNLIATAVGHLLTLVRIQDYEQTPCDSYSAWLDAGTAGLRLQPQLARLHTGFQHLPQHCRAPQLLSTSLLEQLAYRVPLAMLESGQPSTHGAAVAAVPQLLQLHSLSCRLIHWLAGCGEGAALAGCRATTAAQWHFLQYGLGNVFLRGMHALKQTERTLLYGSPEARALCVAHVAAVQAITAAAAAAEPPPRGYQREYPALLAVVTPTQTIARICPAIVTGTFLQPVHAALAPLAQDESQLATLATLLAKAADSCAGAPYMVCSFVSTGLLAMALDCADRLAAQGSSHTATVVDLLNSCSRGLANVMQAGALLSSDAPAQLAQQAAAALSSMRAQQLTMVDSMAQPTLAAHARNVRQLLPAAERVAAAVDAYCQLPSQQATVQLEVARAAAGRSCAYLRCANVQGEGGAAAGEGVGSMRCSACRVVWYCGTACSHADWRAGHKRVCKLLGEERRCRKAVVAGEHQAEAQQQGSA